MPRDDSLGLHWENYTSFSFKIEWDMWSWWQFSFRFSEPNGIKFVFRKSEGKLSPRSYPIQFERKRKYSFLSVELCTDQPCLRDCRLSASRGVPNSGPPETLRTSRQSIIARVLRRFRNWGPWLCRETPISRQQIYIFFLPFDRQRNKKKLYSASG